MNLEWYDWAGIAGTLMLLGAYYLLQAGLVQGNRWAYQLLNLVGAVGVLLSLQGGFSITVLLLGVAWVAITLYGMVRAFRPKTPPPA